MHRVSEKKTRIIDVLTTFSNFLFCSDYIGITKINVIKKNSKIFLEN